VRSEVLLEFVSRGRRTPHDSPPPLLPTRFFFVQCTAVASAKSKHRGRAHSELVVPVAVVPGWPRQEIRSHGVLEAQAGPEVGEFRASTKELESDGEGSGRRLLQLIFRADRPPRQRRVGCSCVSCRRALPGCFSFHGLKNCLKRAEGKAGGEGSFVLFQGALYCGVALVRVHGTKG